MVGVVVFVAFIQLVVDSFHINSATYKEYSQKTEAIEVIQKSNEVLLKQVVDLTEQNNSNQKMFLEQQKEIIEKMKKN
jgi:hypothetical protein